MLVSCKKNFISSKILCSILLCFLRCFHILDLVLPSSHHAAMAKNPGKIAHPVLLFQNLFGKGTNENHLFGKITNENHLIGKKTNENHLFGGITNEKQFKRITNIKHLFATKANKKPSDRTSNSHFIASRNDLKPTNKPLPIENKQRSLREIKKQESSLASKNSSESYTENITKPLNEKEILLSNISRLHPSCCLVSMSTQNFKEETVEWTTGIENGTKADDITREITHEDNDVITTNTQILDDHIHVEHKAAIVVGIVFGAIAAVLFIGASSIIYVYVKRRLSHNTVSKTDLSSILEDHMTMSYIETRYDRQRNMSDEVVSLDNDSFLQSLETTSLSYLPTPHKTV